MSKKDKNTTTQSTKTRDGIIILLSLVLCSVVLCGIYRFMIGKSYFSYILFGYIAAETILIAVYMIYNRAFSRKGITKDMLPADWSEEKKTEFIENGEIRLRRSRWMLIIILSFLFTFAVDLFELVIFPMIFNIIGI